MIVSFLYENSVSGKGFVGVKINKCESLIVDSLLDVYGYVC